MFSVFNIILEVLARAIWYEKEIKGIHYYGRNKTRYSRQHDCLYRQKIPKNLQKTKTTTKSLLDIIREFNKVVVYKVQYIKINHVSTYQQRNTWKLRIYIALAKKFAWVSPLRCYGRTRINFLANPLYCHL